CVSCRFASFITSLQYKGARQGFVVWAWRAPLTSREASPYAEIRPHSTRSRPRVRLGLGGSGDTGVAHSSCQGGGSQLLTPEGLTETESRCSSERGLGSGATE